MGIKFSPYITSLFFALFLVTNLFEVKAQTNRRILGTVADTAANVKLIHTTVILLHTKDSTLYQYTRANEQGHFSLEQVDTGSYILLLTYPEYADYVEEIHIDSTTGDKNLGNFNLLLKSQLLQEVVVHGSKAITLKGDTTEFDAGHYVIQKNDRVEDLLKQLPGIQVDKDGKITAQGQSVKKVLVDGEEFFGDDPTLVTKNLRADMVDKIQLFDKKSEQAEFTGVDDGQRNKTINVKLKEDKKNGLFGKVSAGGSSDYYEGQAMINRFKAKQKFAGYGILGNTNKASLNWQEQDQYGGSQNIQVMDGGGIMIDYGDDDIGGYDGRYDGHGKPKLYNSGLHYDTKWGEDQKKFNVNFKAAGIDVNGSSNTINQNNLPGQIQLANSDQQFKNRLNRQKLDFIYEDKLSETSSIRISADGSLNDTRSLDQYSGDTRTENGALLNQTSRSVSGDSKKSNLNAFAAWNKKFKKIGRTFSLSVKDSYRDQNGSGFLRSQNDFFRPQDNILDSSQKVDQYKVSDGSGNTFTANATYTEPLSKTLSLQVNYAYNAQVDNSRRDAYNQAAPGQYTRLDSIYSNHFKLNQYSQAGGLFLNYKTEKTSLRAGSMASSVDFNQRDQYSGRKYDRHFYNFNPSVSLSKTLSSNQQLRLDYVGNQTQPSADQVQPIRENTDPLNIRIGNPDLKPSFQHNFFGNYNIYKVSTGQGIYAYGSLDLTSHAITQNVTTDSVGKSTYQYHNLNNQLNSNYNMDVGGNTKLKLWDLRLSAGINLNGSHQASYINNKLNQNSSNRYGIRMSVNKSVAKKFDLDVMINPGYQQTSASLQSAYDNNGLVFNSRGNLRLFLPAKFEVVTDITYDYTQSTQAFANNFNRTLWNASLSRKFLKSEDLMLQLSANDLLNQNIGFSRSANNNSISQNSYNTIRRFFLLSVIWDFNKVF
ncbi:Outer membrane receptor proteins, mostly Fe transport [bacterium A37T11]|nr:Outer membrane receptor proteins, mostly Fe transport [bacterium A37T11]